VQRDSSNEIEQASLRDDGAATGADGGLTPREPASYGEVELLLLKINGAVDF
jgi:hypothetical protein